MEKRVDDSSNKIRWYSPVVQAVQNFKNFCMRMVIKVKPSIQITQAQKKNVSSKNMMDRFVESPNTTLKDKEISTKSVKTSPNEIVDQFIKLLPEKILIETSSIDADFITQLTVDDSIEQLEKVRQKIKKDVGHLVEWTIIDSQEKELSSYVSISEQLDSEESLAMKQEIIVQKLTEDFKKLVGKEANQPLAFMLNLFTQSSCEAVTSLMKARMLQIDETVKVSLIDPKHQIVLTHLDNGNIKIDFKLNGTKTQYAIDEYSKQSEISLQFSLSVVMKQDNNMQPEYGDIQIIFGL